MKKIFFLLLSFFILNTSLLIAQKPATILMIIPSTNFHKKNIVILKNYFQKHHNTVLIASTKLKPIKDQIGQIIRPDLLFDSVRPNDFDILVLVGGTGSTEYWTNQQLFKIIKGMKQQNKIISAQGLSVFTLGKAGILNDKRITANPSLKYDLKKIGCTYIDTKVVEDGNIITSQKPQDSLIFAKQIEEKFRENQK